MILNINLPYIRIKGNVLFKCTGVTFVMTGVSMVVPVDGLIGAELAPCAHRLEF